jgi:putative oxidoreductase
MKNFFVVRTQSASVDRTLLFVRVMTGVAFVLHGKDKIVNPFGWMPGDVFPGVLQALAALAEFGGGLALILGLVSNLASAGLVVTMLVAMYFHAVVLRHPFVAKGGPSFEPATTYLLVTLMLLMLGPGRYSLDRKLFGLRG